MAGKILPPLPKRIPFTRSGYEKVLSEKKKLEDERPDAVTNLQKAREMGDLSENGYYKAARQRLSFLDGRLRHLTKLVKLGKIIESSDTDAVEIGKKVSISDGKNNLAFTIVGGYESNPAENTVSYLSPIGKALMGKKAGETVTAFTPAGEKKYRIVSVAT